MPFHEIIDNRGELLLDYINRILSSSKREAVYEAVIQLVEARLKKAESV